MNFTDLNSTYQYSIIVVICSEAALQFSNQFPDSVHVKIRRSFLQAFTHWVYNFIGISKSLISYEGL